MCFSCDGNYLASGSFDSNIHITKPFQDDDIIKTLKHKDKIEKLREKIEDKNATERDAAAAKDEKDDETAYKKQILTTTNTPGTCGQGR